MSDTIQRVGMHPTPRLRDGRTKNSHRNAAVTEDVGALSHEGILVCLGKIPANIRAPSTANPDVNVVLQRRKAVVQMGGLYLNFFIV